ncbi:MAG: type IV pilus twitching motility protein PilT [Bacillota bacterium]
MRAELESLLKLVVDAGASDLHLTAGVPAVLRVHGKLWRLPELARQGPERAREAAADFLSRAPVWNAPPSPDDLLALAQAVLTRPEHKRRYEEKGSCDLAVSVPGVSRFRVNVFRQRGCAALAVRNLASRVPSLEELFSHQPGLAETVRRFALLPRGLVLVTGPTGSGKSTTLAGMVDYLVGVEPRHVVTLEDPIEYLLRHGRGVVNQREVGEDVSGFAEGLRAALREDPDVIVVGEMRDAETIAAALTAAETGHLVLSTLHTRTAVDAVTRIVDVFPPHQQDQVRVQLAGSLQGVLAQQLLPRSDGSGRVVAVEVLVATTAVRAMIRDGRVQEIPSAVQTGAQHGMVPMDRALADLVRMGLVSLEEAQSRAVDGQLFESYLGLARKVG